MKKGPHFSVVVDTTPAWSRAKKDGPDAQDHTIPVFWQAVFSLGPQNGRLDPVRASLAVGDCHRGDAWPPQFATHRSGARRGPVRLLISVPGGDASLRSGEVVLHRRGEEESQLRAGWPAARQTQVGQVRRERVAP